MRGSKHLVIVKDPSLGRDFPPVLGRLLKSLGSSRIIQLDNADQIDATCPVDYHGHSPCHAAVIFSDSPSSSKTNASWEYDIRTDPALQSASFNVFDNSNATDSIILPLQSAIENAMANLAESPDVQPSQLTLRTSRMRLPEGISNFWLFISCHSSFSSRWSLLPITLRA
jgi:hypothetical protein